VDMFFKTGSAIPVLVAARVAKGHAFKSRHTGSVSALLLVPYARDPYRGLSAGNHNRVQKGADHARWFIMDCD